MAQPRPRIPLIRTADHNALIISDAARLPLLARIRDIVLTLLLWAAFCWLVRVLPSAVVDLVRWRLGLIEATADLVAMGVLAQSMTGYAASAALNGAILVGWAKYNQVRFGRKRRRTSPPPLSVASLAAHYALPSAEVTELQAARILRIAHEPGGRIASVVREKF